MHLTNMILFYQVTVLSIIASIVKATASSFIRVLNFEDLKFLGLLNICEFIFSRVSGKFYALYSDGSC